jgi:HD-GYP domain-containing protein (c-di-GMP phosphodiesterase class II)
MGQEVRMLMIGLDDLVKAQVGDLMKGHQIIEKSYDLEKLIEEVLDPSPLMIFCGPSPEGLPLIEVAQALRMSYQNTPIYYATTVRKDFDSKNLKKNGFTDAFLLPMEISLCDQMIKETISKVGETKVNSYRAVRLVDLTPDTELPFDTFIYLAANDKHLKFGSKGDPLDEERVTRLKKHRVSSVQVTLDQMPSFYKFSADQLRNLGKNSAISETERGERMQSAVRDLMSMMFNDSTSSASTTHGKKIASDCQEIVKSYVVNEAGKGAGWYEKILNITGSKSDTYSHASNVATFAALFSMGTGVGKPEELAMAGILHDIGVADIPQDLQLKPFEVLTSEERKTCEAHVELGLKVIRDRKLVVSETVLKAIEMQHERMDGSGYPHQISGKKFLPTSQILALADEFDRLTTAREGSVSLSPAQAIQKIKEDCFRNPALPLFDPEIIAKLVNLFSIQPQAGECAGAA